MPLQGIIGAPSPNPGNAFAGSALYVAGNSVSSISSFPALARLTDIVGTTILQNLALTNLTGLGVSPRVTFRSFSMLTSKSKATQLALWGRTVEISRNQTWITKIAVRINLGYSACKRYRCHQFHSLKAMLRNWTCNSLAFRAIAVFYPILYIGS